jgi:hypothetical protein
MKTKQLIGLFAYLAVLLGYTCYLVIQAIEAMQQ